MGRLMEIALSESCNEAVHRITRERLERDRAPVRSVPVEQVEADVPPAAMADDLADEPEAEQIRAIRRKSAAQAPKVIRAAGGTISRQAGGVIRFENCNLSSRRKLEVVKSLRRGESPYLPEEAPGRAFKEVSAPLNGGLTVK